MTERQWLRSRTVGTLLHRLPEGVSDRQLLLFACACARRFWGHLSDPRSRGAVEATEEYAEGRASRRAVREALAAALDAERAVRKDFRYPECNPAYVAAAVAHLPDFTDQGRERVNAHLAYVTWAAVRAAGFLPASAPCEGIGDLRALAEAVRADEARAQIALLRDVAAGVFRPVVPEPSWLRWKDGCVGRIARHVYDERCFADLPILADALLDAGCDDEALLTHLRGGGPHVRGCWALDLLLGQA
jgi:hypothetical protein